MPKITPLELKSLRSKIDKLCWGRDLGVNHRYLVLVELGNTFGRVGEGYLFIIIDPPTLIFVVFQKSKNVIFLHFDLGGKVARE